MAVRTIDVVHKLRSRTRPWWASVMFTQYLNYWSITFPGEMNEAVLSNDGAHSNHYKKAIL